MTKLDSDKQLEDELAAAFHPESDSEYIKRQAIKDPTAPYTKPNVPPQTMKTRSQVSTGGGQLAPQAVSRQASTLGSAPNLKQMIHDLEREKHEKTEMARRTQGKIDTLLAEQGELYDSLVQIQNRIKSVRVALRTLEDESDRVTGLDDRF